MRIEKVSEFLWEIPKQDRMNVPGRVYATEALMQTQKNDEAVKQVANVACLPGIVGYALAMPDFHWGYGFPIGGVAAFDVDDGVISPGGVGYDINCGVRVMRTNLTLEEVKPHLEDLTKAIFRAVPAGVGAKDAITVLTREQFKDVCRNGARWAVENGYGKREDLDYIEEGGCLEGTDFATVSNEAIDRGKHQLGTLGSGNHFLEIQYVDEVHLPGIAERLGLKKGGITISIHSGSRGFGHQTCDDYLRVMMKAAEKYRIYLPDRQLCCAPLKTEEGRSYLSSMKCAANFAFANRQVMRGLVEDAIKRVLGTDDARLGMRLIYDVCHNIAKVEEYEWDGQKRRLCVHRKGATRALPPGHPLVPKRYQEIGQPVLIPGDMGRSSYILVGAQGSVEQTFGSSCHGAGRVQSRSAMIRRTRGQDIYKELREKYNVLVMGHGRDSVAEEMPDAYKDATDVVKCIQMAGISKVVAKLRPIACVKG